MTARDEAISSSKITSLILSPSLIHSFARSLSPSLSGAEDSASRGLKEKELIL